MTRTVDEVEAAFRKVKASAEKVMKGDESARDEAFEEIFALNNEIGRLAREEPSTMSKMRELQGWVNAITVGMKYDRPRELREGLDVTERAISSLRKELASSS